MLGYIYILSYDTKISLNFHQFFLIYLLSKYIRETKIGLRNNHFIRSFSTDKKKKKKRLEFIEK
jgi:hypothetical protein